MRSVLSRLSSRGLCALLVGLAGVSATSWSAASAPSLSAATPLAGRFQALQAALHRADPEGSRAQARQAFRAFADTLVAAGADSLATAALSASGRAAFLLGDLEVALADFERGLEVAERADLGAARVRLLNSMAVVYAGSDRLEMALEQWHAQLPLRTALGDELGVGLVWGNIATALTNLGRTPEALRAIERAEAISRRTGNLQGLASIYHALADLLLQAGRFHEAHAAADSSVAVYRRQGASDWLAPLLVRRALSLVEIGRNEAALNDLEAAVEHGTRLDDNVFHVTSALLLEAALRLRLGQPAEALARTTELEGRLRSMGRGREWVMVQVMRGLCTLELGDVGGALPLLEEALASHEAHRESRDHPLSRAGSFASNGEVYAALGRALALDGDAAAAWELVERGRATGLRERLGVREPLDLRTLQELLAETDAALLHLDDGTWSQTWSYWLTPDSVAAVAGPNAMELAKEARAALRLIASGAEDRVCREPLARIEAALAPQLARVAAMGQGHLLIVAPTLLADFPFEVLTLPNGSILGEAVRVSYLPSASMLPVLLARQSAPGGLLALADPAPGAEEVADPHLSRALRTPLPGARDEARAICRRGDRLLVGRAATRRALVREATAGATAIHFATHAWVNETVPERSALLLAGEDGILTAEAVEGMRLSCDLVTLSGCETGGGFTFVGEGTIGLARAFLIAGARSVVTSAWPVSDRAAERFMRLVYDGLRLGRPRAEALRQARAALASAGYSYRDRAAFRLTGVAHEPVPLAATGGGFGRRLWLVAGALSGLGWLAWRRRLNRRAIFG